MAYAADQSKPTMQMSARTGSIIRFVWHHQAGTDDDAVIRAIQSGARQLSCTWTANSEGRITALVPENMRPWTSDSMFVDGRALTCEVENESGGPEWRISDAAHEACARLAAYAFVAYGIPLRRITSSADGSGHIGHGELPDVFGEGYATFCPGHLDIDRILTRAAQLVGGGISSAPLGGGTQLSEEDDLNDDQAAKLDRIATYVDLMFTPGGQTPLQQIAGRLDGDGDTAPKSGVLPAVRYLIQKAEGEDFATTALRNAVAALGAQLSGGATDGIDEQAIADIVIAGVSDGVALKVLDGLHARLAAA